MVDPNESEVDLSNHSTYYAIAYKHLQSVKQRVAARDARKELTDDNIDYICKQNAAIHRETIVAIIFSALTLEAFINHYGLMKYSKRFFTNHLDKMNPRTKWLLLPRLITGKGLSTDSQEYEMLTLLFRLRDELVHYKTRRKKVSDLQFEDWMTEKNADNAVNTVSLLASALENLDPTVDISWLDAAATDPYA